VKSAFSRSQLGMVLCAILATACCWLPLTLDE